MPLVVEDGSIVPNANSYISLLDAKEFYTTRGHIFESDSALEQSLVLACDYINIMESRFQGERVQLTQGLAFPRSNLYVEGVFLLDNVIHRDVIMIQLLLSTKINRGINLFSYREGAFVTKEKVGQIQIEYSEKLGEGSISIFPDVNILFEKFYSSGSASSIKVVRI